MRVAAPASTERRRTLRVWSSPPVVLIEYEPVAGFGFAADGPRQSGKAFAARLNELSRELANDPPVDPQAPGFEEELVQSLLLSEDETWTHLDRLREVGAALRATLSDEVVDKFREAGFLREPPELPEPALLFQGSEDAPVLWEMMYEGNQEDDPDWERFWGFRVPLAHWIHRNRTDEIRLHNGVFSATHEQLKFAGREVDLVQRRLLGNHADLAAAIRARVEQAVHHDLGAEAPRWWRDAGGEWLKRYLEGQGVSRPKPRWVERAVLGVLREDSTRGLLHFACHCAPSIETEFLSALEMSVCGEPVTLKVAGLLSGRRGPEERRAELPGPLVFLNACGTGQQAESLEPPGFPRAWIEARGAIAVIATLCPVPDHFAFAFARKFYEILLGSELAYVDEALLAARRHFMESYGNPLGLAYVLYAFENAHVRPAIKLEAGP